MVWRGWTAAAAAALVEDGAGCAYYKNTSSGQISPAASRLARLPPPRHIIQSPTIGS